MLIISQPLCTESTEWLSFIIDLINGSNEFDLGYSAVDHNHL